MTPDELEKFRNLLLKWREDLLSTSDVRDASSGTKRLEIDPTSLHCIGCAR